MSLVVSDLAATIRATKRRLKAQIADRRKVFAEVSPKELRSLETILKKIGKRAESLGPE